MNVMFRNLGQSHFIAAAGFLILPLSILAPLGIAPLAGTTALAIFLLACAARRPLPEKNHALAVLLTCFIGWSALTVLWSLSWADSADTLTRLVAIAIGALYLIGAATRLDEAGSRRVSSALLIGSLIGGLLLAFALVSDNILGTTLNPDKQANSLAMLNRAASVFVILVWATTTVMQHRFGALVALTLIALCGVATQYFEPVAPRWAIYAGIGTFGLALWRRRVAAYALLAVFWILVLASPFVGDVAPRIDSKLTAIGANNNSVSHRLGIWSFTSARLAEKPVAGWGLGTARLLPGGKGNVKVLGRTHHDAPAIPLHPHSAFLQIWVETGLPGTLFAGAIVTLLIQGAARAGENRFETAATLAMIASALTVAFLSYGIWQGWWQTGLWLSASLMIAVSQGFRRQKSATAHNR